MCEPPARSVRANHSHTARTRLANCAPSNEALAIRPLRQPPHSGRYRRSGASCNHAAQRWLEPSRTNGGVLRAADGATLSGPVTERLEGRTLQAEGWTATLNPGWVVRP